jgi:hypothetical protein
MVLVSGLIRFYFFVEKKKQFHLGYERAFEDLCVNCLAQLNWINFKYEIGTAFKTFKTQLSTIHQSKSPLKWTRI